MKNNVYKNAFSTPYIFSKNNEQIRGTIPNWIRQVCYGGIYDEQGELIQNSLRKGGYSGDHVLHLASHINRYPAEYNKKLSGRTLYLGPLMNHYGHFITETRQE